MHMFVITATGKSYWPKTPNSSKLPVPVAACESQQDAGLIQQEMIAEGWLGTTITSVEFRVPQPLVHPRAAERYAATVETKGTEEQ